ncbi:unnamed protein product [Hydatigera taeniaeformis]|uniref:Uncharacterized protein n=1 Tax=Hydatigena taeniaeformis TaxID=6205 RepID=A0A0R3WZH4_HYDTA|nr:unnamed protein product [Hydatigera taeniaeformis]
MRSTPRSSDSALTPPPIHSSTHPTTCHANTQHTRVRMRNAFQLTQVGNTAWAVERHTSFFPTLSSKLTLHSDVSALPPPCPALTSPPIASPRLAPFPLPSPPSSSLPYAPLSASPSLQSLRLANYEDSSCNEIDWW